MQLFKDIQADTVLSNFIVPECEEEGICVSFDTSINRDETLIIKVDAFYNSLQLMPTPPSVDCLILQYCNDETYKVYLVELKNVKTKQHINNVNLEGKFETTLFDFMSNRFRTHFFKESYQLKTKLILTAGKIESNIAIRSWSLDFLLGLRLFTFQNKILSIEGHSPNMMIKPCKE